MSHKHDKAHIPYCLNCHYPLAEYDSFCPNCGQKPTDGKVTTHDLLHEFLHSTFHIEGKVFTSLRHLFIPGKLTEEFFRGHHKRYAHPIQLFLVLGAFFLFFMSILTHSTEDKLKKELDKANLRTEKKRMLASLDSTARQMASYKKDATTRKAMDSLLANKLAELYANKGDSSSIRGRFFDTNKEIARKKVVLSYLDARKDSLNALYSVAFPLRIRRLQSELKKLQSDSAIIAEAYAKKEKLTPQKAENSLNGYILGRIIRKDLDLILETAVSADSISNSSFVNQKLEDFVQKKTPDLGQKAVAEFSKSDDNPFGSAMNGFNAGLNAKDSNDLKAEISEKKNPYEEMKTDSIRFLKTSIARTDLQDMGKEEIFEKYHIVGFLHRLGVGRLIMVRRQGNDMFHTFLGKTLWIMIFSLLPTAAFMLLLYRRQKRFFVEHVVWLLHINCLFFLLFPMVFIGQNLGFSGGSVYLLIGLIFPYFALKRYYKQGWIKTFVKYLIFTIGYTVIFTFTMLLGLLISFLFL